MSSEDHWRAGAYIEHCTPGVDDSLIYVRVCHTSDGERDAAVLRRVWDALVVDPFIGARRHDWRSFLIRRNGPPDLAGLCDRLRPFLSERVAAAVTEVGDDFESALLRIADVLLDHRSTVVGVVWVPRRNDFVFTSRAGLGRSATPKCSQWVHIGPAPGGLPTALAVPGTPSGPCSP